MDQEEAGLIRAIVGARVSRVQDDGKTSHTTQRESGERYASAMDWDIVGFFEDLDVSASIAPWDRPDLGPWLNERANDWDALIFSKVDRAFRSIKDCSDVAHWAEQNRKILVFSDDGIVCNFREDGDPQAQMIAKLFLVMTAMFAELELKRFKGRNSDARKFLNTVDRWPGGTVPYGFKAVPHPEGAGYILVQDPETSEIVRMIGQLFLAGRSTWDIANYLTSEGFPTPRQHRLANAKSTKSIKEGREPSSIWNKVSIRDMLQNPMTMGYKVLGKGKNRKLARDDNGYPIRYCEGIFTEEEWTTIQAEVKKRGNKPERRMNASPLLGVVYCGSCGHRLYRNLNTVKGHKYVYYRCPAMPGKPACPAHGWREDYIVPRLDQLISEDLSEVPVLRRVFVPGEDHTQELETVMRVIQDYLTDRENGVFSFPGGDKVFADKMAVLNRRATDLAALPQRSDSWEYVPTGETFADAYGRMTEEQRRMMLINAGVQLHLNKERAVLILPDDLRKKAQTFAADLMFEMEGTA